MGRLPATHLCKFGEAGKAVVYDFVYVSLNAYALLEASRASRASSARRARRASRAELAEPAKPAEPAAPAEPAEPAEPGEPAEPAETAEPAKPREHVGMHVSWARYFVSLKFSGRAGKATRACRNA